MVRLRSAHRDITVYRSRTIRSWPHPITIHQLHRQGWSGRETLSRGAVKDCFFHLVLSYSLSGRIGLFTVHPHKLWSERTHRFMLFKKERISWICECSDANTLFSYCRRAGYRKNLSWLEAYEFPATVYKQGHSERFWTSTFHIGILQTSVAVELFAS